MTDSRNGKAVVKAALKNTPSPKAATAAAPRGGATTGPAASAAPGAKAAKKPSVGGLGPNAARTGLGALAPTATRPAGPAKANGTGRAAARSPRVAVLPTGNPERFINAAPPSEPEPVISLRIHAADRVLVRAGDRVERGQPVLERCRETSIVELARRPSWASLRPGDAIDTMHVDGGVQRGGGGPRPGDRARLIYHGTDGRDRIAIGRHVSVVTSVADGVVETITAGSLQIRADGLGLRGTVGWGQPVAGRILFGVGSPDAELRASAIDIGAAGTIIVAGARLDIEALTRARAIGAAGIICGGVVGRELRQLEEADRRQRAALHAAAPFALVALDGYGRRPIPGPLWDILLAASGRPAGLVPEGRLCVIGGEVATLRKAARREAGAVRVAGGDAIGSEGRLVGLAGPVRLAAGQYAPGGYVDLPGPEGGSVRRVVPLADLERIG